MQFQVAPSVGQPPRLDFANVQETPHESPALLAEWHQTGGLIHDHSMAEISDLYRSSSNPNAVLCGARVIANARLPRATRLSTASTEIPKTSAISPFERPSMWRKITACLCRAGKFCSARCKACSRSVACKLISAHGVPSTNSSCTSPILLFDFRKRSMHRFNVTRWSQVVILARFAPHSGAAFHSRTKLS